MDNKINNDILDKITKVCLCKGISRASIKKAIIEGADTLEKIQRKTGAGSGSCRGQRCTAKILELLEEYKNGK